MRLNRPLALALLGLLAACGRAKDESEALPNDTTASAKAIGNATKPTEAAEVTPVEHLRGSLDEMAGVRVGMTLAELGRKGVKLMKDEDPDPEGSCGYARLEGADGPAFMLDGETVVRIDVSAPNMPTLENVAVGMSESEAVRRLKGHVEIEPHPYTGPEGHYLVVHEPKAILGLILETDGKRVESYRIGRWDAVQYIEGCS